MLLYLEIDNALEFRRVEQRWPALSASLMPIDLRGAIKRDPAMTADDQAARLIAKSGWVGHYLNARSEAGRIWRGRREWYCPDSEEETN